MFKSVITEFGNKSGVPRAAGSCLQTDSMKALFCKGRGGERRFFLKHLSHFQNKIPEDSQCIFRLAMLCRECYIIQCGRSAGFEFLCLVNTSQFL